MKQLALPFDESCFLMKASNDDKIATAFDRDGDPFYRSTAWQRLRYRVLDRDGARCKVCGKDSRATMRIDVDHVIPRRLAPHLALVANNLQVLCAECHQEKTYLDRLKFPHVMNSPMRARRREVARAR